MGKSNDKASEAWASWEPEAIDNDFGTLDTPQEPAVGWDGGFELESVEAPTPSPSGELWVPGDIEEESVRGEREEVARAARAELEVLEAQLEMERVRFDETTRELREEAMRRECEGLERGLEDGYKRGTREERERLQATFLMCEQVRQELESKMERWMDNLKQNIALMAVTVARQIVSTTVEANGVLVGAMVQRAVETFGVEQPLRIRVNPIDCALLRETELEMGGRRVVWLSDEAIERGGVTVEGVDHIVDGRLDVVLEGAYRRIVGEK